MKTKDILILIALLMVTSALAQERPVFEYAVKFVCGKSPGRVVAPGEYFTAINIHNPTESTVKFRKKFAIALPGEQAGPISKFTANALGPDEAMEIDCPDIMRHTHSSSTFRKGFVVIQSPVELDIVAVYTASGRTKYVETLEIERVQPRRVKGGGLADLVPVPDSHGSFCKRVPDGPDAGKLVVTVRNQGTADAPASTVKVDFLPGGPVLLPCPPIAAGMSVDLPPVAIPGPCFDPDCDFRITVDSNTVVTESNEGNNAASGKCIG